MRKRDNYPRIRKDATLRETAAHGSLDYPFCYYEEDIWLFDLHCVDWHWHPEVELVYLAEGEAEVCLGSGKYTLQAGEGVFVNAQAIHRYCARAHAAAPNIVFSPALLAPEESLLYRRYIQPVLSSSLEGLHLSPGDAQQGEILRTLREVFAVQEQEAAELRTVELLLRLWRQLYAAFQRQAQEPPRRPAAQARAQLQIMMRYLQEHYRERVSLEDLARTVSLSKNSVLHLFRTHLHTSPVHYLTGCRLRQAARLLAGTEDSIAEIALSSGFESAGYFSRRFKEWYAMTPGEYRRTRQMPL